MSTSNIWDFGDYKKFMKSHFKAKEHAGRGQLKKLADYLGVHSTLISQVVNGSKDFSDEQTLRVATFLQLTAGEVDYFIHLVHLSKAGTSDLASYHKQKLLALKENALSVGGRVGPAKELTENDKIRYYSDWSYVAVWLATSVQGLGTAEIISEHLGVSRSVVKDILDFLLATGLCKKIDKEIAMNIDKTHIPQSSSLVKNHHLNWRLKSLEFVKDVKKRELAFTAPISVSQKDFDQIKKMILNLVAEISEVVANSKPEVVACLNIDHFFVTK